MSEVNQYRMPSYKLRDIKPRNVSAQSTVKLSPAQLQSYRDNGYLVIKGLIDPSTLNACRQRFIQIANKQVYKGEITVVRETALKHRGLQGEDLINKLQDISDDEVFVKYIESPVLLDAVSQLIGEDLLAIHSMFINKPPGSKRHPPHQDLYYFPFRPAEKIVAAWTAVDDVTIDNGCLWVIPGSHLAGKIYPHDNLPESSRLYHGILSEDVVAPISSRVHVEMSPGDTIFFHPLIIHGSGPNVSKRHRKCLTLHYMNSACHAVDVAGSVQEPVRRDYLAEAERRGIVGMSFHDIWIARSKHVKGRPPSKL